METQASNVDKALLDSVIIKLKLEGKFINKKNPARPGLILLFHKGNRQYTV